MHLVNDRDVLAKRVAQLIERGTTETCDEVQLCSSERYTDPGRYAAEVRDLFGRGYWLASAAALSGPETFVRVPTIDGTRVLTRDKEGACRVLVDACGHRGARLTTEDCGSARRLTCPYHGWAYTADGSLVGMPDKQYFDGFEGITLAEADAVEAVGFVGTPGPLGADNLVVDEALADELKASGFDRMVVERREVSTYDLNWKVPLDTFLENYHTRVLHRRTIADLFLTNIAAFDAFGSSCRVVLPKRDFIDGTIERGRPVVEYATVLYYVYPNVMLALLPGHAAVWQIIPLGVGQLALNHVILTLPRERVSAEAQEMWAASLAVIDRVVGEDISGALMVQNGLVGTGHPIDLHIGRCEPALQFVHGVIDDVLLGSARG